MRRRTVLSLAAGGLLGLPVATAPAQTAPSDYGVMYVKSGKKTTQAKLGTHCHPDGLGGGACVEAPKYPLPDAPQLTVRAGSTVTLLLKAPVASLLWRGARIDALGEEQVSAYGRAKATSKTLRKFSITLPRTLRSNVKVMGFDVNFPSGGFYSSFEIRVKVLKALPRKTRR